MRPTRDARRGSRRRGCPRDPVPVLLQVGFAVPPSSPRGRCALTAPFHPCRRLAAAAVCSLLHCPSSHLDWPLASTMPCGARTFLDRRPEAPAATVCPTRARSDADYTSSRGPFRLLSGDLAPEGATRPCPSTGRLGFAAPASTAKRGSPRGGTPPRERRRRVSHLDWPLASTLPCGARTFLDGRPEAPAATVCPTRARNDADYTRTPARGWAKPPCPSCRPSSDLPSR